MAKKKITRTPEQEHNLLYARYLTLNAFDAIKRRVPERRSIEKKYDELSNTAPLQEDGEVKDRFLLTSLESTLDSRTKPERSMFLQGSCTTANDELKKKAFSDDKDERQEFINNLCETCPVKSGCLNYALEHPNESVASQGVWGGTHPEERARYRPDLQEGLINPLDTKWFPEYKEP
jgi:hypothetical protein